MKRKAEEKVLEKLKFNLFKLITTNLK